jgi:DNA-binding protein H-NS
MKTYMALKSEIAKLERQAETLRKNELKDVITKIRRAIDEYGLTAADLGFGAAGRKAGKAPRKAARKSRGRAAKAGVAKYRHPATGQTWTGHGRPPAWIADAKNRDDFLIAADAAPAPRKRATRAAAKKATAGSRRGRRAVKTPAVVIESGAAAG